MLGVGEKVRRAREELNMTQRELAGKGLSRALISQIENGKISPSFKSLAIIAERVNKSLSYFMDDFNQNLNITGMVRMIRKFKEEGQYLNVVELGSIGLGLTGRGNTGKEVNIIKMNMGEALYRLNRIPEAIAYFDEVYESSRNLFDTEQIVKSLYWIANCCYQSGQYFLAYKKYERVVHKARDLKTLSDVNNHSMLYMAASAYRMGDLQNAIKICEMLYFDSNANLHPYLRIDAGLSLSWIYFEAGDICTAIQVSHEIQALSMKNGEYAKSEIDHNFGVYLYVKGRTDDAMKLWQSSYQYFKRSGRNIEQATVMEEIAKHHLMKKELNIAESYAHHALDLLRNMTKRPLHAKLCRVLGQIEQQRGNYDLANGWYQLALETFRICQSAKEIENTMKLIKLN